MTAPAKTKVAVITPSPTPYRVPFFRRLAQCEEIAVKVFFLTAKSPTRPWQADLDGFEWEVLRGVSVPMGRRWRYRISPSIISRLRRGRFDCIVVGGYNHFTTEAAIVYAILTDTPWCLMSESHSLKARGAFKVALKRVLLGPILRRMGAAMVTGTLAKEYLQTFGVPAPAIFTVSNIPDVAWFRDAAEAARPRRDELKGRLGVAGKRVILFAGRLIEEKGIRVLIDAFAAARASRPDLALVLVGNGSRSREFQALVAGKNLADVHFLGFRSQSGLPEIYAAADVFVLPSLSEPWGVVVCEAMACGLPVIVSDRVGASADLVEEGQNGFVVEAGDAAALAARIIDVFADDVRRALMAARSRDIISRWDYRMCVGGFLSAVSTAVAGKVRPDA